MENKNIHSGHRQRVKDSALENGFLQLEDHKLLELLLFYSIPREDTNETAHALLNDLGNLENIFTSTPQRLMKVKGVGKNTALMLCAIGETYSRLSKCKYKKKSNYQDNEDLKELVRNSLVNEKTEKVFIFCFDSSKRLKKQQLISVGNVLSVDVDMLKIVETVIDCGATYAVLAHNHPESDENPSAADVDTTRNVALTLRKLGFKLIDHIIVGETGGVYSMYEDPRFTQLFY